MSYNTKRIAFVSKRVKLELQKYILFLNIYTVAVLKVCYIVEFEIITMVQSSVISKLKH